MPGHHGHLLYGNMYCSILLLRPASVSTAISGHRVHPFTYRLPKRTCALLTCGLVWTMVFLYMLPFFILKQEYYLVQQDISTCHDVHNTCASSSALPALLLLSPWHSFWVPNPISGHCLLLRSHHLTLNAKDRRWLQY